MTDESADTTRTATRRPLRRPREGRIIGGVAAGLADHLGIDVSIVRILIVVLTFVTQGLGLVAYVAAVLIVPSDDDPQPPLARGLSPGTAEAGPRPDPGGPVDGSVHAGSATGRDASFWLGVTLLVVGAVWLFGAPFGPGWVFGNLFGRDLLLAGLLIAFGVALWQSGERRRVAVPPVTLRRSAGPPPPVPFGTSGATDPAHPPTQEFAVTTDTSEEPTGEPVPATSPPAATESEGGGNSAAAWTPPPVKARSSDALGRITLGVATMVAGLLWMLSIAGVGSIGAGHVVAGALLVVGLGLLVGAFVGRARWLIVVGLLLVPLVLVVELARPFGLAALDLDLREGAGDLRVAPSTLEELDDTHRLAAGRFVFDLREIDVDQPTQVFIDVGAGDVEIHLPDDVTAEVRAAVGVGQVRLDHTVVGGLGVERDLRVDTGAGSELLRIEVQLGVGQITVRSNPVDPFEQEGPFEVEEFDESEARALPMTLTTTEVR